MSPELEQAVKERISLGHSQEQITTESKEAGYDDQTIAAVYNTTVSASPTPATVDLPSATSLFKQSWAFAISRPDLLVLLALPTFLINGGVAAMQVGWVSFGGLTAAALGIGFFAVLFLQFLIQLTLAHTALATQRTGEASLAVSWSWATSNVWAWLWIATISFSVVFGGLTLLVIPGVIASFYIAFAMYTFVDEDARGMSALQKSRALVTGNFWDILSRFFVFILIILGLGILLGIVAAILTEALGVFEDGAQVMVMSVFGALLTAFASLLGVYFAAGLYLALKQQPSRAVEPSIVYPVFAWIGAIVFMALVGLVGLGAASFMNEVGPEGFDFEQMMNLDTNAAMIEAQAELSPEQQAEFDAFIKEFGEELDSY